MPEESGRQLYLEALRDRLVRIRRRNGFSTDAGLVVFVNETPSLGPSDPCEAIAMVVQDDEVGYQGEHVVIQLPVEIHALARADLDQAWVTAEQVLSDVKRAVELADRRFGGLVLRNLERGSTRTLERQEGSTTVGVSITYIAPMKELWGAP